MTGFHSFADIFALWKSAAAAGRDLGIRETTARAYAAGKRPFPADKFDLLVAKARTRPGGENVSHEVVCRIAAVAASQPENSPAEMPGECFT